MKTKITTLILFCITLMTCAYDLDDNLTSDANIDLEEIIKSDSNLFKHITAITNNEDRVDKSIACIDFLYPLTIYVFNANDELLYSNLIGSDDEFSQLLNGLEIDQAISVSFPITSTLESGEELIINTKEDLNDSINNCLDEEILAEGNGFIQSCVLKLGYSYNDNNPYLGSIFNPSDGQANLRINDTLFNGSWSTFTIEQELHINLSLNDTTEVGAFFNLNWKVNYLDGNTLELKNNERELILNRRCDTDFATCGNFIFARCETELDSGISDFLLDDYSLCIFDTLELNEDYELTYHETEEDAFNNMNAIISGETYTSSEGIQNIFVRLYDAENDEHYYALIQLKATSC